MLATASSAPPPQSLTARLLQPGHVSAGTFPPVGLLQGNNRSPLQLISFAFLTLAERRATASVQRRNGRNYAQVLPAVALQQLA